MTSAPILIFGATGQVGRALKAQLGEKAVAYNRDAVDFSQPQQVKTFLEHLTFIPAAVINASAYTAVDKAEEEEAIAFKVNAETPGILATFCAAKDIPFIHYSTDYVFDGSGHSPRLEDNPTQPLNAYGRTKLAGEKAIAAAGGKYLILRTSWVYDEAGKNFFNTMMRLGAERENLRVVSDQIGAPTYAPHLAEATLSILQKAMQAHPFPSGIYHACGVGETSWHGFAEAIFATAKEYNTHLKIKELEAIPSELYPTPATRPLNSRLDCSKLLDVFGVALPDWKESLSTCVQQKVPLEQVA